jgi:ABC-2 type transport system permease protein
LADESATRRFRDRPPSQLTLARIKEFFREPAAVFWVYGFPLLLALALGTAFRNRPVEKIKIDIVDGPHAPAVQLYLAKDSRLNVTVLPEAAARERLRIAKTDLILAPTDHTAPPKNILDPNRPESALAKAAAESARLAALHPDARPAPPDETPEEPGGRYIDFLIPGLLGTNLMGGGLWGVGFVTVDLRVRKLLKRFLATPMKPRDFLLSLMLSRILFTLIEIVLLLGFAYLVFDIRVRGNLLAFGLLVLAGGSCFAGIGLLVASRAKTIETVSGLMNAVMLPMYVASGVFFSADRFPDFVQPIIQALPLTGLIDGLRAVMNDGAGLSEVLPQLGVLSAWGIGSFLLALKLFRWR